MEIQAAWMVSLVCQAKSANNNSTNEFAMFLREKHNKQYTLWKSNMALETPLCMIFLVDFTIQTSISCGDSSQDVT